MNPTNYPESLLKLKMLHGADYNPEQWADYPEVLKEDIDLMKNADINCVSVGIFSWAKLEPEEGVFTLDWLADLIDRLYENGISAILATPSGSKPIWMSEKYQEIRRVAPLTGRNLSGERHNHCYTSPVYREKVKIINTKLAERFAKHPGVILWHLSNEYGGVCYCDKCQQAFREWLKARYENLDALNHAWWTTFWSHTYTDWSQIHAPVPNGESNTHGLNLDWKRFTTDQVIDFIKAESDTVKAFNPNLPTTANLMYDFYTYNYNKLASVIDVVSWDSYPMWHSEDHIGEAAGHAFWHDYMRSLKKQPFLLMESCPGATNWQSVSKLKKPNMHMTASMQAVAHGSNSVQYFQFRKSRGSSEKFHGSVVDHVGGSDTRIFRDVAAVGKMLKELSDVASAINVSDAAIIYDTENRWAVEDAAGPRNTGIHYIETVRDHYRAFWEMGINTDIIDADSDLSSYKLVAAPMLYMLREGVAQRLKDFVSKGGTLISTYHSGIVDGTDLCLRGGWPGDGLMELFGIWNEEIDGLYDGESNSLSWDGGSYTVSELCAIIHSKGAEILGEYESDFYAGSPALTVNNFGAGKAYYIAARPESAFLRDFYEELTRSLGIRGAVVSLPDGVEAVTRQNDDCCYLFLQNFTGQEKKLTLPEGFKLVSGGDEEIRELVLPGFGNEKLKMKNE